jgi:hypothetical protein
MHDAQTRCGDGTPGSSAFQANLNAPATIGFAAVFLTLGYETGKFHISRRQSTTLYSF